ncbi:MAG: thermonuclease family protein [Candidatus Omnitrophica bacterium]|nr:thermonuclease family protein [Candidatus Omnitrophota bacterium]
MSVPQSHSNSYIVLLKKVRGILLDGQKQITQIKIRIYWETGKVILRDILENKARAQYGSEVIAKLSGDLGLSQTLLTRCVKFAKTYPKLQISAISPKLKWSHFCELLKISDEDQRAGLEANIQSKGLSIQELSALVKQEKPSQTIDLPAKKFSPESLLKPLRGLLYHYKVIRRPDVAQAGESDLLLDLGFRNFEKIKIRAAAQLTQGDIVCSSFKEGQYRFAKVADATDSWLYTYEAKVERVIDGDTLKVRFDQGFDFQRTETLRLRGIDCPELKTKEGQAAKDFVQSLIKQSQTITVRSSRPGKYDRYLADVFIAAADGDIFLNNLLLETAHAVRWV